MELRPYQVEALAKIRGAYRRGKRSVLVVSPTGSGKGVILAQLIHNATEKGSRVLFLVHRREILFQVSAHMDRLGIPHGVIMASEPYEYGHKVDLATVQTISRRMKTRNYEPAEVVIVDECFPAGTLVGGRRIETIEVGDRVASFNEKTRRVEFKRVARLFKSRPQDLVTVYLADGNRVTCTKNHPFYVDREWKPAILLESGDMVQRTTEGDDYEGVDFVLPRVPRGSDGTEETDVGICAKGAGLLQRGVFFNIPEQGVVSDDGKNKQGVCQQSDEGTKPDEEAGCCGKDENDKKSQRHTQLGSSNQAGERDRAYCPPVFTRISPWLGDGIRRVFGRQGTRVPDVLQTGHSESCIESWNRGGREKSHRGEKKTGCKKRRETCGVGVASVEVHERGDSGGFGEMCPDGYVYNIEVEDNHNYFANGILVHNCHHSTAKVYTEVITAFRKSAVVGFTATPCRKTGHGLGHLFDELVNVATIADLTSQGYLVPVRYFAPSEPDLKGIKVVGGDYVEKALEGIMLAPKLVGDVVENWARLGEGRQTVVFTTTVAHSVAVCDAFNAAGIPADHVDGRTNSDERDETLRRFRNGDTRVLCNCQVFTEGVDIPDIACVVMARPTKSLALYMQTIGRGMRPANGKRDLVFIDHAGACYEHGPVHEICEWELDDKIRNTNKENEERKERNSRPITCEICSCVYTGQLKCPECRHIPDLKRQRKGVEYIDANLGEVCFKTKTAKPKPATAEEKQRWYSELIGYARMKGYQDGWISHKYRSKFGCWPRGQLYKQAPPSAEVLAWVRGQAARHAIAKANGPERREAQHA